MRGAAARWLRVAAGVSRRLEDALLMILLTAMILIGGWQIFMRNVLGVSLSWADESQRLLLLWLALLGAVAASRDRRQLRIDLAARYLKGLPLRFLEAGADLLTAAVSLIIGWYSLAFVRETYGYGDMLMGTVPAWAVQIILPVAFFMIGWRHLLNAFLSLLGRPRPPAIEP
jgi:TRAP-type C4-dicarboxylate transport system permease small subunit